MEKNPKIIEIRRTLWEIQDLITEKERLLVENPDDLDAVDQRGLIKDCEKTKDLLEQVIDNLNYLF